MKKYIVVSILLFSLSLTSFAKKDVNAWKNEKNLKQQFSVFKENLNYWNGNYFMDEKQLNDFYKALSDSVTALENQISNKENQISTLKSDLGSTNQQLESTKTELETSIKNRNSIDVLGITVDKNVYTLFMALFIVALALFVVILFFLYKRSNKITLRTKKDYTELKEEFEVHKKDALERYTKINMELHHTRMELNKK